MTAREPRFDKARGTTVHIKCAISGEPAEILLKLKDRGLVTSNSDVVIQGVLALWEKVLRRDLRAAQTEAPRRLEIEE